MKPVSCAGKNPDGTQIQRRAVTKSVPIATKRVAT